MGVKAEMKEECTAECEYMGICRDIKRLNELQEKDPLTLTDDEHEMLEKLTVRDMRKGSEKRKIKIKERINEMDDVFVVKANVIKFFEQFMKTKIRFIEFIMIIPKVGGGWEVTALVSLSTQSAVDIPDKYEIVFSKDLEVQSYEKKLIRKRRDKK